MSKSRFQRLDFITALMAILIGLCTMFVYIYQARIMSRQMEATTWPYLEVNFSEGEAGFMISVHNKGVGPAIVKKAYVVIDKNKIEDTQRKIDSLAASLTGTRGSLNGYTNIASRVISAGDVINFVELKDSTNILALKRSLAQHNVRLEICYCSVLGDCYRVIGSQTTACDSCD
jgi:hypothetical protein